MQFFLKNIKHFREKNKSGVRIEKKRQECKGSGSRREIE
jgi:hypothetical protein